jgi:hypothetical protein
MLTKTDKARDELQPGRRTLSQRERAMLLLADGQQTESRMASLFGGDGKQLIDRLLLDGFLQRGDRESAMRAPSPAVLSAVHGDLFKGTRSLATARMFLFDLSERLFAPRDKALALRYRQALRDAPDARAMLTVGREMIDQVSQLAGSERADGISERLARLLPLDLLGEAA